MPVVSSFKVILGNSAKIIEDVEWSKNFSIEQLIADEKAVLTLMVRGLDNASTSADVIINGDKVGNIVPYNGVDPLYWFNQTIVIIANVLKSGPNTIKVKPVGNNDNFAIKSIVCYYK